MGREGREEKCEKKIVLAGVRKRFRQTKVEGDLCVWNKFFFGPWTAAALVEIGKVEVPAKTAQYFFS